MPRVFSPEQLSQGIKGFGDKAMEDLRGREEDIQRGKTVELLRRAGKEMYDNPIVNTAIGFTPVLGDVQAAGETMAAFNRGAPWQETAGYAAGMLPFIPALGGITKNIKPETLEQLGKYFDESAIEAIKAPLDYKSRTTTVLMSPNEFLAYAAKSAPDTEKLENIKGLYAQGNKIEGGNLPFLNFDVTDNVAGITGHEGRNRARYLQEQGLELMPVNIKSSGIRWSEQANPNRFDYVNEWPQTLQNQDLTMQTPFPLTREGEYISSMSEQQALSDPFWRKEAEAPKANKQMLDELEQELLAKEFEDYFRNQGK